MLYHYTDLFRCSILGYIRTLRLKMISFLLLFTEMDALKRSLRILRKERIRNVTIRQQIGLEETII
jgi:hypothetical protein